MRKITSFFSLWLLLIFLNCELCSQWIDAYIPDFKVNDDNLNSYQTTSSVGVDSAGNFVIVWRDVRNNPGNTLPPQIYCQRYNKDGLPLGNNFRIGHDTAGGVKIAVMNDGKFIVNWSRSFLNYTRVEFYFQRFKNGEPLNQPTRVIDSVGNGGFSGFHIASDIFGKFIICWGWASLGDSARIYFQRYDSSGNRIGVPQRVNEAYSRVESPNIAINNAGSFVIAWQDNRNNTFYNKFDIYMQRYDANGIKIGNNIKVNDDLDSMTIQFMGGVSTDKNGFTVVTWSDERLEPIDAIFYQIYDQNGIAIGPNRRADVSTAWYSIGQAKVSMREDRKFFISWLDLSYAGKDQIYGRRFSANGNPIGNPYMVPMTSPGNSTQNECSNYLLGDRVYVTWTDNRNGGILNYDIYCNVRGFQNPDTVIGIVKTTELANEFELYSPYPNPFNAETNIKFYIADFGFVTIKIFDVLGKEIETLVNDFMKRGSYNVKWNANNFPSGIYFIDMRTSKNFKKNRKIVLTK